MIEWKWSTGDYPTPALRDAFDLRSEVFCDEQGYTREQEFDSADKTALHITGYTNGQAVAAGRIIREDDRCLMGRICVKLCARGTGAGYELCTQMIQKCRSLGYAEITVIAQSRVAGFYSKLGFSPSGEEYPDEAGVVHVEMRLTPAAETA